MFTTKAQVLKKTGPDGTGRFEFLKQLITEFTTSTSSDAKYQTLANLANFAYDPFNFEYFKQLHAIDLFLAQLSEDDEDLIQFALGGLCNISPDEESKSYIIGLNGITLISNFLLHEREEISVNAVTTLYFLLAGENHHLLTPEILKKIRLYKSSSNARYRNLGEVLLDELGKND